MGEMLLDNNKFLEVIKGNSVNISEFVSVIELLKDISYKVLIQQENNSLMNIYNELYTNKNEDVKIISKLFEKLFSFKEPTEFNQILLRVINLGREESISFKEILLNNGYFDDYINIITYANESIPEGSLRNVNNYEDLKTALLLFTNRFREINSFTNELRVILSHIVFDEDIDKSIEELNDGFDNRKNEIIYHLYCIQREIPNIISQEIRGYQNIGSAMSLDCSPERSREIVKDKLVKVINGGKEINCELHTKMEKISTRAPDRIYFCPCIPVGTDHELDGKIYIYKITKHA
ncbi:hypothetical protein ACU64V_18890 [Lysinibacillus capsici]|uniref:Uncharacterized protein n=1 Tax=Lysinibacillus fusiformis TaxID=28031 RepID=A0A2I0V2P4_9BACI|nr:hypothetical protein [Lysinibacillus fusiformis]PKU52575.1 hypothetical protein CRI88_09680 [Lysinibacillus fusiformis]